MTPGNSHRASAGIVIFHPDEAQLARLVSAVAPGLREVVIFANSALSPAVEADLQAAAAPTPCTFIRPGSNVGLGVAYDAFVDNARQAGDRFVLLLDQDSLPPTDAVSRLAAVFDRLLAAGETPAIVGPLPLDPDGQPMKLAKIGGTGPLPGEATRVAFAISSGSLVDVAAAADVGPFRADFFIDGIDLEWCFRATSVGRSVWVADTVRMDHRLGRGVIRVPVAGLLLADQPPRRLYTFLRNQLAMLRLPHVPRSHKVKTVVALPLRIPTYLWHNGFSRDARRAIWNGLRDGLAGRLGSNEGALR